MWLVDAVQVYSRSVCMRAATGEYSGLALSLTTIRLRTAATPATTKRRSAYSHSGDDQLHMLQDGQMRCLSGFPARTSQSCQATTSLGDGTQWVEDPGRDRVVEFRLKLVQPRKHALNLTPAMVDECSVLSFIKGFRLMSGEVLLVFAVDGPLYGARREKVNRMRARERRNTSAYFDRRQVGLRQR